MRTHQAHPHAHGNGNRTISMASRIGETLDHWARRLLTIVAGMPLAEGVIVIMAATLTIGSFAYNNMKVIAIVTQSISVLVVASVGSLTLWLLKHDRRKDRKVLEVAVLVLMAYHFLYLVEVSHFVLGFAFNVVSTVIMLALFFASARGVYEAHPEVKKASESLKASCDSKDAQ